MSGERRTTNGEPRTTSFDVRRSAFAVLLFVLSSLFLVLSSQFSVLTFAQEPVFKSGSSELVVLPVVVTDKQGRYISDLASERFSIFDNGRKVPIELFTNED